MPDNNPADTQPIRLDPAAAEQSASAPRSANSTATSSGPANRPRALLWLALLLIAMLLTTSVLIGAAAGYRQGIFELSATGTAGLEGLLEQQVRLADQDAQAGRYDIARQRYEFVLDAQPNYPGLEEKLAGVQAVLYATSTATATDLPTATATLTPTPDVRPIQDRFASGLSLAAAGDWEGVISLLVELRKDEPAFNATKVDGLLYLALRYRGVDKIYKVHDLAGGIYDLSLAENFGPLDQEAEVARNLARIYLIGSGFWEAYPEQAVYFFSQVAAAAPYLQDGSGWTATERYRGALIQYGDQFANSGDWCTALEQYQQAAAIHGGADVDSRLQKATEQCYPAATEPAATLALTTTPTPTLAPPTPTLSEATPTETLPPTLPPAPTDTPVPPTETQPPPPTDTPEPPSATPGTVEP